MKKVIVCGTRFGQFYIEGLKHSKNIQLVGILAQGSRRSQQCASHYNIPLFLDIEDIPLDTDIACIAVKSEVLGGNGSQLAIALMKKGIHILFEQPLHLKEMAMCFNVARENRVKFAIGNLYNHLPAVKNFVENSEIISNNQQPLFINIDFATQLSYPVVELIYTLLPNARNWKFIDKITDISPFQTVVLNIDGIEVTLRAHNEIDKDDIDGYMHLFFQFTIGYSAGRLNLVDPHSLVTWQPRVHFPEIDIIPAGLVKDAPESMRGHNICRLYAREEITQQDIFVDLWTQTISKEIERVCEFIKVEDKVSENKRIQLHLLNARRWHELMTYFGYPHITQKQSYTFFDQSTFKRADIATLSLQREVERGIHLLNRACFMTMLYSMQEEMPNKRQYECYKIETLLSYMRYKKTFKVILLRWINILKEHRLLAVYDDMCCFETSIITEKDVQNAWCEAEKNWYASSGPDSIFRYFKDNADNIASILTGELDPMLLLFKEGGDNIALDLYSKTAIARYLNPIIAQEVAKISDCSTRILEIGAGTGATTQVVCDCLSSHQGCDVYIFSDLSKFFLNNAKVRFSAFDWMHYHSLDINKQEDYTVFEQNKIDIIIAVGVLNNAVNIKASLLNMLSILNDDGILFLVEAIGESAPMLISQAFMMEQADDNRADDNVTFLGIEQWYKTFKALNLNIVNVKPDTLSYLNVYNQKLFILKKAK